MTPSKSPIPRTLVHSSYFIADPSINYICYTQYMNSFYKRFFESHIELEHKIDLSTFEDTSILKILCEYWWKHTLITHRCSIQTSMTTSQGYNLVFPCMVFPS